MTRPAALALKEEPAASAGLRASLSAPNLQQRRRELLDRFEDEGDPNVQPEAAQVEYMMHDFTSAVATAQAAYRALRREGRTPRAALAASTVGRIYSAGLNNHAPARGECARVRPMRA